MKNEGEIILYQPDNEVRLEVRLEDETVWLTQAQMAALFQTSKQNVSLHTNNIFKEKELRADSVVKDSLTTASDGKHYRVKYYNLDVIISVGYRVKSIRGTQFRQWANRVLKEYLLKGYSVNQRLNQLERQMDCRLLEHEQRLDRIDKKIDFFVRTSLPPVEGVFYDGQIFDAYKFAADLYVPKNAEGRLPAIAMSGPYGAVKEQVSGRYAQALAERGFLTIAFDPSFTGESGGKPRGVSSPDINTEDFCAAVDYLSTRPDVDPERVGILGVCGFGGFAVNVAAMDTRIKATVAVTMYDMTRVTANGYFDEADNADARHEMKKQLNAQRTEDYRNGNYAHAGGNPEAAPDDAPQFLKDYVAFYKTSRGYHPRSLGSNEGFTKTSALPLINMPILARAGEIRSAVMLVHGENAHSRYFSEDVFKKLMGDNKELLIVPGAVHTDLYDNLDKIPFDEIERFYDEYLK